MHIKTLVLDNFKSFGRKTEIPFYEDFSTVSGPNGSGKSNIIDAILFSLGLARSHGIRAKKLTDLIYNPGIDSGREQGPAEATVEVVLDNADETLSNEQIAAAAGTHDIGDGTEIRIKRRVKRTDDNYYSYYYLNGRSVNLSDIRDLLAQAGVTPEGYNVVMQGDVTGITSITPYRRREIIDEIAGVAEFDAKKEDALDELEIVKDRIDEAELRIQEKQDRLDQLEDERETALEYQGLKEEKEEYEGYLKAAELEEKRHDLQETRSDIEDRKEELESLRDELDERTGRVVRIQEELKELNREIERKGEDEQLALQREIESIKGEISRLENDIETAETRIEEAESTRRQSFIEIDKKQEQLDELSNEIRSRKLEKASLKSDIQSKQEELDAVTDQIDEIGEEYEELKTELEEHKAALEEVRNEKNELQREQDRLLDEARRRSNERTEIENQLSDINARTADLETEREDLTDEVEKTKQNLEQIESVVSDLREEQSELQADISTLEDELQGKQQEYAELEAKAESSGDSSFGRAVTSILNSEIEGVHGTVAHLGSVEEHYAVACETAAGGRLANIVVSDDSVGQACIEYLKRRNSGRATFLPISEMEERSLPSVPTREGVIDFAINLVEYDETYSGIFSYVLGDTLVVDTLETARSLMGQYRIVTLAGDLVERSGAMTGGSSKGSRYSFTSGKGRLQRVAEEIESLEEERRTLRESLQSTTDRLEDARDRKSSVKDELREIESQINDIDRELEQYQGDKTDLEERLDEIKSERESVETRMQEIEESIAERDSRIDEIEGEIDQIQDELAGSQIPELTEKSEGIKGDIETLENRVNDVDAALNELQLEESYTEETIDELHDKIESAQNQKAEQERRIDELEEKIETKEESLSEKHAAIEELEDELTELKEERESLRESLAEAEDSRDEKREEVSSVENRVESLVATEERLVDDISELESIVEEYDPDEIPDHETVQSNINRLTRAMNRLEPVNMLAIEEYDAVADELADLEDRKDTLVEEREGIRERIDRYETQKKDAFMDAFNEIDSYFQDIFQRLSNGTGELILENPDDPFEGGLTMRAEPGDKPVQRLDAMSGGEKSLTALAFIFAIQRHNPAPFYALDEVDAFLDAANAERVGELLDELASDAQFIVVSHRAALLERSERAIGVTMQDNNISSVTGIAMADGGSGRD